MRCDKKAMNIYTAPHLVLYVKRKPWQMIFLDHRNPAWIHLNDIINFRNVWQAQEKHTSKNNNIWLVSVFDPPGYMHILKATNKLPCNLMCSLSHGTQNFTNYQDINQVLKCMSKQINLPQNLFPKVLTTRWPQYKAGDLYWSAGLHHCNLFKPAPKFHTLPHYMQVKRHKPERDWTSDNTTGMPSLELVCRAGEMRKLEVVLLWKST